MAIQRISAPGQGHSHAILLRTDKSTYVITPAQAMMDTEEEIVTKLEQLAAAKGDSLGAIFVHKNDDGSIAFATGWSRTLGRRMRGNKWQKLLISGLKQAI